MNLRTGTVLGLLAVLLGLVARGTQEEGADVATFEEAPCPFELPASIVQGQDILCGYVTVPEVHAQPEGEMIRLEPFTDATYGIRGRLPAGWVNAGPGTFVRLNSTGELAFLLMARLSKLPLDQHLGPRLQRLGVDKLPEISGRYATDALTWDLYILERTLPSLGDVARMDLALAETDAGIYLVALYATPEEYAALHAAVFVPAVEALAPLKKSPNLGRQTCGEGL